VQCSGLSFEHVEIVFQIEDLLRALVTALVLRPATPLCRISTMLE
jgi:hypothetical protein